MSHFCPTLSQSPLLLLPSRPAALGSAGAHFAAKSTFSIFRPRRGCLPLRGKVWGAGYSLKRKPSAASIQEGLELANDVLCLTLYDLEQEGTKFPEPSEVNETAHDGDSFVSLVACDTDWYRRFYESKSVKKTLSIPAWLNDLAEKNALNFSQVLQEALRNKLGIG